LRKISARARTSQPLGFIPDRSYLYEAYRPGVLEFVADLLEWIRGSSGKRIAELLEL
jgi:hypothetical protein